MPNYKSALSNAIQTGNTDHALWLLEKISIKELQSLLLKINDREHSLFHTIIIAKNVMLLEKILTMLGRSAKDVIKALEKKSGCLKIAASQKTSACLELLLKHLDNIDAQSLIVTDTLNALYVAVNSGALKNLQLLLNILPDDEVRHNTLTTILEPHKITLLETAALAGDVTILQSMLAIVGQIEMPFLLNYAAESGNHECVQAVINKSPDYYKTCLLNNTSSSQHTPLQAAAYYGDSAMFNLLIGLVNDDEQYNIITTTFTGKQRIPIHLAIYSGNIDIVQACLKTDETKKLILKPTTNGYTLYFFAAYCGFTECLEFFNKIIGDQRDDLQPDPFIAALGIAAALGNVGCLTACLDMIKNKSGAITANLPEAAACNLDWSRYSTAQNMTALDVVLFSANDAAIDILLKHLSYEDLHTFFKKKTVEDFKSPKSKLNILINKVHQRLLAPLAKAIKENHIIDKNLLEFIDFCSDNTPDFFYKITVGNLQNQLCKTHQIAVDEFVSYAEKKLRVTLVADDFFTPDDSFVNDTVRNTAAPPSLIRATNKAITVENNVIKEYSEQLKISIKNKRIHQTRKILAILGKEYACDIIWCNTNEILLPLIKNNNSNLLELLLSQLEPKNEIILRLYEKLLRAAIKLGSIESLKVLLRKHNNEFDILTDKDNGRINGGSNFFHIAAHYSCLEIIDLLLDTLEKSYIDPKEKKQRYAKFLTQTDNKGNSPLQILAKHGHFNYLQRLITTYLTDLPCESRKKLQRDLDQDGSSLLHYAANSVNPADLEFVINLSPLETADISLIIQKNSSMLTPLHHACMVGCIENVTRLSALLKDEHIKIFRSSETGQGDKLIELVVRKGSVALVKIILARLYPQPVHTLACNSKKQTLLHIAASEGNIETLKYLLILCSEALSLSELGEYLQSPDAQGNSVLNTALATTKNNPACIHLVMSTLMGDPLYFHPINLLNSQNFISWSRERRTPLGNIDIKGAFMAAIRTENHECIRLLLKLAGDQVYTIFEERMPQIVRAHINELVETVIFPKLLTGTTIPEYLCGLVTKEKALKLLKKYHWTNNTILVKAMDETTQLHQLLRPDTILFGTITTFDPLEEIKTAILNNQREKKTQLPLDNRLVVFKPYEKFNNHISHRNLRKAVKNNDLMTVKATLESLTAENKRKVIYNTEIRLDLFFIAIVHGQDKILQELLEPFTPSEQEKIIRSYNAYGMTLLHASCAHNQTACVKLILYFLSGFSAAALEDKRLSPRKTVFSYRIANESKALHIAAVYGNDKILKLLLEHTNNISDVSSEGNTPLHLAAASGSVECVNLLLDKVDLDTACALITQKNHQLQTPLFLTAYSGNPKTTEAMIEKLKVYNQSARVCHLPYNIAYLIEHPDINNDTALLKAASIGNSGSFRALIKHVPHTRVQQMLLKQNKDGSSIFHYIAYCGDAVLMKICLDVLADKAVDAILKPNNKGQTPLYLAAYRGKYKTLDLLLNQLSRKLLDDIPGVITMPDKYGFTAIHAAAASGNIKCLALLHAYINAQVAPMCSKSTKMQKTQNSLVRYNHTYCSVIKGKERIIPFLTPLHIALIYKNTSLVQWLFTTIGATILESLMDDDYIYSSLEEQIKLFFESVIFPELCNGTELPQHYVDFIATTSYKRPYFISVEDVFKRLMLLHGNDNCILKLAIDYDTQLGRLFNPEKKEHTTGFFSLFVFDSQPDIVKAIRQKMLQNDPEVFSRNAVEIPEVARKTRQPTMPEITAQPRNFNYLLLNELLINSIKNTHYHSFQILVKSLGQERVKALIREFNLLKIAIERDADNIFIEDLLTILGNDAPSYLLNTVDTNNFTLIHMPIEKNNIGCLKILLERLGDHAKKIMVSRIDDHAGDKNPVVSEYRILHRAALSGNVEMIRVLLDYIESPEEAMTAPDADGNTPLYLIAKQGSAAFLLFLEKIMKSEEEHQKIIDHGRYQLLPLSATDTPADRVTKNRLETLNLYLSQLEKLRQFYNAFFIVNTKEYRNIFHEAIHNIEPRCLDIILDYVAHENRVKLEEIYYAIEKEISYIILHSTESAKDLAAALGITEKFFNLKKTRIAAASVLADKGAQADIRAQNAKTIINAITSTQEEKGHNTLAEACIANNVTGFEKLLNVFISMQTQPSEYLSKLIALFLLQDTLGNNILHLAAYYASPQILAVILNFFEPPDRGLFLAKEKLLNTKNNEGQTPLYLAAYAGMPENVKLILDSANYPLDSQQMARQLDVNGDSPLRAAVSSGNVACVQLILRALGNEAITVAKQKVSNHGISNHDIITPSLTGYERCKSYDKDSEIISSTHLAVANGDPSMIYEFVYLLGSEISELFSLLSSAEERKKISEQIINIVTAETLKIQNTPNYEPPERFKVFVDTYRLLTRNPIKKRIEESSAEHWQRNPTSEAADNETYNISYNDL